MHKKCVAVIAGTVDIHQPLYRSLKHSLENEVFLIHAQGPEDLFLQLTSLAKTWQVWVFPSNEMSLNAVTKVLQNDGLIQTRRIRIPGTAQVDRIYAAAELSNKAILSSLLKDRNLTSSEALETHISQWPYNNEGLVKLAKLKYPFVSKPAIKDENDSFTHTYPEKICIIESEREFNNLPFNRVGNSSDLFVFQELKKGSNVSWCGYASNGQSEGYCIVSIIKSPDATIGGTTTLAKVESPSAELTAAVDELVTMLSLDGIFEIEFIQSNGRLYFPYEINPRPWLQVGLILQQNVNIFVQYLLTKGFAARVIKQSGKPAPELWGSASRYLELNTRSGRVSIGRFIKTWRHDIRYSEFFDAADKFRYTLLLLRSLFLILLSWLRRKAKSLNIDVS